MLVVVANVVLKKGCQDEFVKVANDCIKETRKEEGNISYNLLLNTENDCSYTFLEEWKSKESLDLHATSSHFNTFAKGIQELLAEPLEIKVYDANLLKS